MTDPDSPRIVGGSPTEEETAAIAAVFAQLLVARAAAAEPLPAHGVASAWERSRRGLRQPTDGRERAWSDLFLC